MTEVLYFGSRTWLNITSTLITPTSSNGIIKCYIVYVHLTIYGQSENIYPQLPVINVFNEHPFDYKMNN